MEMFNMQTSEGNREKDELREELEALQASSGASSGAQKDADSAK